MEQARKAFFLLIGLGLVIWSFSAVLEKPAPAKYQPQEAFIPSERLLKAGTASLKVEIADTDAERSQGLSGRESLAPGSGMLFIFEMPGVYSFWMKEMRFPLDIVWIDEYWTVISVEREVKPESFPHAFMPSRPAQYVLELRAGEAVEHAIDTGSKLYLTP